MEKQGEKQYPPQKNKYICVKEIGGIFFWIWVKYHLEIRNENIYNNCRKPAETRFETVFLGV